MRVKLQEVDKVNFLDMDFIMSRGDKKKLVVRSEVFF
jgi:hypothetical protein